MDNLLFSVFALTREKREGTVERDLAEMVRRIPAKPAPMVVLCDGPPYYFSSYVTAFSPHVSWDAPETMVVPYYAEREQWALEAESGKHGGFAGLGIDYVIVHQQNTDRRKALIAQGWKLEGLSGQMELYRHP